MSFNLATDTGIDALNTVLAQQANIIGEQVYRDTLHVTPWIDLCPQTKFPPGLSYQLNTLLYDRSIPTKDTAGTTAGMTWHSMATLEAANQFNQSLKEGENPLADTTDQTAGPLGGDTGDGNLAAGDTRSFVRFSKKLKPYTLQRAQLESPKLSLEDLLFAVHREQQLKAVSEILTEVSRYAWENRNRDEYIRVAANLMPCLSTGTPILTSVDGAGDGTANDLFEGYTLGDSNGTAATIHLQTSGASNADVRPDAHLSNAVLDKLYQRYNRRGAGLMSYGKENNRPVYAMVLSSEASYYLQTEAGYRDDMRFNNARVSDLISPLGVERSFRGFYHLIDDLAPRFTLGTNGLPTRVLPYITSSGIMLDNPAYETATHEAAIVMHPQVLETQVPEPLSGAKGINFDPLSYRGDFKWTNIKHATKNPDGTIGHFRAVLAAATKPIKTHYATVILFERDATPAIV